MTEQIKSFKMDNIFWKVVFVFRWKCAVVIKKKLYFFFFASEFLDLLLNICGCCIKLGGQHSVGMYFFFRYCWVLAVEDRNVARAYKLVCTPKVITQTVFVFLDIQERVRVGILSLSFTTIVTRFCKFVFLMSYLCFHATSQVDLLSSKSGQCMQQS